MRTQTLRVSIGFARGTDSDLVEGISRQSLTTAKPVKNACGYEMQYAPVDDAEAMGVWIDAPFSTSSRNIPVDNLVSGKVYVYRVRAMGGMTAQSDWSESVSHRAY